VADLVSEHCREYPSGTPPLGEEEAAELHREVPDWQRDGNQALRREFSFDDFNGAFGLVARVALLAEAESHHPEIELEWGRAAFRTWTHTASGLSRNDFILAAKIDQLAQR
jgi:4a-hydroxytetrahydrobiopterin dehydratase